MKALTEALRLQLMKHPGVTICGGEVETITRRDGENAHRVPAYFNSERGDYDLLTPDSSASGIVFMRVLSTSPIAGTRSANTATVRVVVWGNADRLTAATDGLTLSLYRMASGDYTGENMPRCKAKAVRMLTDSEARGEWLNFDLNEQETQFMMRPYFVGGFDVECGYTVGICAPAPQTVNAC